MCSTNYVIMGFSEQSSPNILPLRESPDIRRVCVKGTSSSALIKLIPGIICGAGHLLCPRYGKRGAEVIFVLKAFPDAEGLKPEGKIESGSPRLVTWQMT